MARIREQNNQLIEESTAHRKELASRSRDLEQLKHKLHQAEKSRDNVITVKFFVDILFLEQIRFEATC
jgi:hypothetical protein